MANQKISALTSLTGANVEQLADVLPIVDNSASVTKKILVSELAQALLVLGTEQATTSGTEKDFTIPAWAKRATLTLAGVSTSGTSPLIVQLGDGGGIENTGYSNSAISANTSDSTSVAGSTAGQIIANPGAASSTQTGHVVLTLENASAFTWVITSSIGDANQTRFYTSAGSKATSAAATTIRLTTVNGSDTFDAGAVNMLFE